jgi:hypothetical protein
MAVLTRPLVAGGIPVAASGSRLLGRIETISGATQSSAGRVRIVFRELEFRDGRRTPVWVTQSYAASAPNRTVRSVLYAGAGGIVGAFIGGQRMRAAGAIGGGLIGFIIAINSGNEKLPDLTLKRGQVLHLRLGEDLSLKQTPDENRNLYARSHTAPTWKQPVSDYVMRTTIHSFHFSSESSASTPAKATCSS